MKKLVFCLAVFTLVFGSCDKFNVNLTEFILESTSMVSGHGYTILTDHFDSEPISIPPADELEETKISVALRNPQKYDVNFIFKGYGSGKVSAILGKDKQEAIVTIKGAVRGEEFDLIMEMFEASKNRTMHHYHDLPKMQARYI